MQTELNDEIWQRAVLIEVEKKPQLLRDPLVVLVQKKGFSYSAIAICKQNVLGTYDTYNDYMLENGVLKNSNIEKCRFPQAVVVPVDCDRAEEPPVSAELSRKAHPFGVTLSVFVSHDFLEVYGFFNNETVWFRPARPYPLTKVVLVPTRSTARWSPEHLQRFVAQLYAKIRAAPHSPVVVHSSFDYYHYFVADEVPNVHMDTSTCTNHIMTFHVMETLPLRQGCITSETTIAFLPPCHPATSPPMYHLPAELKRRRFSRTREMENSGSGDTDIVLSRRKSNSASEFDAAPDDTLKDDEVFNIQVLTVADFKLLPHFIVVPKSIATAYHIYPYQHVIVTACKRTSSVDREDMDMSDVILPLTCFVPDISPPGNVEEDDRAHYAIAVPYEDMAELEHFIPRPDPDWDYELGSVAFVHPEMFFFLFPETLSLSRSYLTHVDISRVATGCVPTLDEICLNEVSVPSCKDIEANHHANFVHLSNSDRLLSPGDVFSVSIQPGVYTTYRVAKCMLNKEEQYLGGMKVKSTAISVMLSKCHSYIATTVPPSVYHPSLSYWEDVLPAGMEQYCNALFSFFIPLLTATPCCAGYPSVLVTGPVGVGKGTVVKAVAKRCRMHVVEYNCFDYCNEPLAFMEKQLNSDCVSAVGYAPCVVIFKNIHVLGREREDAQREPRIDETFESFMDAVCDYNERRLYPVIVVGITSQPQTVSPTVRSLFLNELPLGTPNESERSKMLETLASTVPTAKHIDLDDIAKRTAGFRLGDFVSLFTLASQKAFHDTVKHCFGVTPGSEGQRMLTEAENQDIAICGVQITQEHMDTALSQLHSDHSDAIGAPKIPTVEWKDIGGLEVAKQEILDTIQLPLLHPELFTSGLKRSGVLLYGPPGTGKTLLAKAVATECSLNFLSVKGPELINMYVGQSEENVREVFTRAQSAAPCVIFFDELDSIAPNRGKSGDSGGVMDRIVSQLLAELDGLKRSQDVYVIGATNRPDLIDPALLRPGRFDRLVYLGVSEEVSVKHNILKAITRKFKLSEDVDLLDLAKRCPSNLTGADLYALCSDAMLASMRKKICELEKQKHGDDAWDGVLEVTTQDFMDALGRLTPSVTQEELKRYKEMEKISH